MKKYLIPLIILLFISLASAGNLQKKVIARKNADGGGALSTPTYVSANRATASTAWGTTNTVSFTPAAGTNRCFIAFSVFDQSETASGCTFDGNAMTLIQEQASGSMDVAMYYYCTDTGTSAINVIQTVSGSAAIGTWVIQIDGVKVAAPLNTSAKGEANGIDPLKKSVTVDTTGINNCLLIGGAGVSVPSSTGSVCDTTGQTLLADFSFESIATSHSGYYDHSTAGAKAQCYQSDQAWENIAVIIAAFAPNGS